MVHIISNKIKDSEGTLILIKINKIWIYVFLAYINQMLMLPPFLMLSSLSDHSDTTLKIGDFNLVFNLEIEPISGLNTEIVFQFLHFFVYRQVNRLQGR